MEFQQLPATVNLVFITQGITFSVYSDRRGVEKIFPFDLIPARSRPTEWKVLEAGLTAADHALNLFCTTFTTTAGSWRRDHTARTWYLQSTVLPTGDGRVRRLRESSISTWCGTDLIRDPAGKFLVLEDNGRTPSGVSYVLENRVVMKRVFPRLFQCVPRARVEDYPHRLRAALLASRLRGAGDPPCAVLLSPGPYNSAYFEHSSSRGNMGIEARAGAATWSSTTTSVFMQAPRRPRAGRRDLPPAR